MSEDPREFVHRLLEGLPPAAVPGPSMQVTFHGPVTVVIIGGDVGGDVSAGDAHAPKADTAGGGKRRAPSA